MGQPPSGAVPDPGFGATPSPGTSSPGTSRAREARPQRAAEPGRGPARQFSEDSLQLDYEGPGPAPSEEFARARATHEDQTQTTITPGQLSAKQLAEGSKPKGLGRRALGALGVVLGAALLLGAVSFGALLAADYTLREELEATLAASRARAAPDTFEGYVAAHTELERARELESFLGASVDGFAAAHLSRLPGLKAGKRQRELLRQLVILSALLEQRHAHDDAYQASAHLERAQQMLGERDVAVLYAQVLEALPEDPAGALERAELAQKLYPEDPTLAEAHIEALLAMGYREAAWTRSTSLRRLLEPNRRQRLAVARAAIATERWEPAREELDAILSGEEPTHLEAHMAMIPVAHHLDDPTTPHTRELHAFLTQHEGSAPGCLLGRAHVALAEALRFEQEMEKARVAYIRATEECPSRPDIAGALLRHLVDTGERERAREQLARTKEEAPSPMLGLYQARLELVLDRGDRVQSALKGLPENHPEVAWVAGHADMATQSYEQAMARFERGAKLEDYHGRMSAWAKLARLRAAPVRAKEVDEELDALATKHDQDPWILRASGMSRLARAQRTEDESARADLLSQAHKRLSAAAARAPIDARSHRDMCHLYTIRGRVERARASCERALKLNPASTTSALTQARLWLDEGQTRQAVRLLAELDARLERHLPTSALLVRALMFAGDLQAARDELGEWSGVEGADEGTLTLLQGLHAFNSRAYVKALGYLERAVELRPADVEAEVFLAYARIRLGDLKAAEGPLLKHLKDPSWGGYAWLALGELRRRQGRFDDAEENLERAAKLLQNGQIPPWYITEAYLQRALAWQDRHGWRTDQVQTYLKLAAERGTERHPELNYVRGLHALEQRRADYERAAAFFQAALAIQPTHCPSITSLRYVMRRQDHEDSERYAELTEAQKTHCEQGR